MVVDNRKLKELEELIGVEFNNPMLLLQAVTHRSRLNEDSKHPTHHNERLEFLGDAVLELIVTEHLYKKFPEETEGTLTRWRGALVRGDRLAKLAEPWRLNDFLMLSRGERLESKNSASRVYICACAVEAIIGALYLDQGMGACRMVVDAFLIASFREIIATTVEYKSDFQNEAQARFGITPHYEVLKAEGPDHGKTFEAGVFLGEERVAVGTGMSKKEAETEAARCALETINSKEGHWSKRATGGFDKRLSEKGKK